MTDRIWNSRFIRIFIAATLFQLANQIIMTVLPLYLNDLNMPFLADQYATNSEPSQGSPFLSPAETEQMAEAFRDKMKKFVEKRSPSGDRDDGVEKKLKRLHRGWPWVGRQRPTEEYLGPPQPYPSYSDSSRLMRNTPSGQGVI